MIKLIKILSEIKVNDIGNNEEELDEIKIINPSPEELLKLVRELGNKGLFHSSETDGFGYAYNSEAYEEWKDINKIIKKKYKLNHNLVFKNYLKLLPEEGRRELYLKLLDLNKYFNNINEIKIISNVTSDMVKNLYDEVLIKLSGYIHDKNKWNIFNMIFRNEGIDGTSYRYNIFREIQKLNSNQLKEIYKNLLELKQSL